MLHFNKVYSTISLLRHSLNKERCFESEGQKEMRLKGFILCAVAFLASTSVFAEESQFTWVYTTDLLPKGKKEVEQWMTLRHGKIDGTFDMLEGRTELEYGVSDRFQTAIYGIYDWTQAFHNGPGGATTPPEPFSYYTPGPDARYQGARYVGTALEGIYRVLSPYTDWIGLSLYEEPTAGQGFVESESKVILQKDFLDDTVILAANLTYAPEWRHYSPGVTGLDKYTWNEETDANAYLAASYRFRENWSAGAEFLNEREYNSYDFKRLSNCGYYLGPSVHYGGKAFFVSTSFLEQMPWAEQHADTVAGAFIGGRSFDNDFEKYRVRVKLGYYF